MPQQNRRAAGDHRLDATAAEQWVYVTRGNELLHDIARTYGITASDLIRANPGIRNVYSPPSGTALVISLDKANEVFSARLSQHIQDERRKRLIRWTAMPRGRVAGAQVKQPGGNSDGGGPLTVEQLAQVVTPAAAQAAIGQVNQAMREGSINTPSRMAAFLANVAHESMGLTKLKENGPDSYFLKYEPGTNPGRNVGNTKKGDGPRFKGRGMIQLTGRENYTRAWKHFGLPLTENPKDKLLFDGKDVPDPDRAADPTWSAKFAAWYWDVHKNLNQIADELLTSENELETFKRTVKLINGGYNGLEDRLRYYRRAKKVFGMTGGTIK